MEQLIPNILVVDDNPDIRDLLQIALESHGHRAVAVVSGDLALLAARHTRFDAALVDVRMPGRSGLATAAQLKDGGLPILLMTGGDALDVWIRRSGHPCLKKPFRLAELVAALTAVRHAGMPRLRPPAQTVSLFPSPAPARPRLGDRSIGIAPPPPTARPAADET